MKSMFSSRTSWFILCIYFLILIWWIKLFISGQTEGTENYLFGALYPLIALIGGVNGIIVSRKYGGLHSIMGKGIIFLSLALLGQVFGQFVWSYYNIIAQVEIPYPSIADVGYFSVIPFNCLAMFYFARASGANVSIKTFNGTFQIILIPLVMLLVAYFLFFSNNPVDYSDPIKLFLDLGYPFGEAIYISLAILTYTLTKKLLGGVMRDKMIFVIVAFVLQFITDYTFLYSVSRDFYYNGGYVDLMYATSFTVFSLCLVNFKLLKVDK